MFKDNFNTNVKDMLKKGEDPKEMLIEMCKPQCKFWGDKLERCENALRELTDNDPEKSCMYPMRDWVTCVEGCVQPKIQTNLVGQ